MAKVISFINLKGGVGKTTCAVAMAEFLAKEHDQSVLLIDLDPQTNATIALISEEDWQERDANGQTIRQLFQDMRDRTNVFDIDDAIIQGVSNVGGGIDNLCLLPSSLGLIEIQDQLALIPGSHQYAISPVEILAGALRSTLDNFDYVLIDCPPNLGIITLNGILISNGYVIPTIPDILSTYGIPQILNRIGEFSRQKRIHVDAKGIIVSKYRAQSGLHNSKLQQLQQDAASGKLPPILMPIVPEATHIAESPDYSATVSTLRQKYGYGKNYETYSALALEFMRRC